MKVVAFNGSPHRGGNTSRLVRVVFEEMEKEGIETELVEMAGSYVHGCTACYMCKKNQDQRCVINKDPLNDYIQKMIQADGIILASPTHFSNVTSEMKALIDRAGMVGRANGNLFERKIGASVTAVRRAGALHAFNSMNHFFFIEGMIVPGSDYWNLGVSGASGKVEDDPEGLETMRVLGRNMAWLLKKTRS